MNSFTPQQVQRVTLSGSGFQAITFPKYSGCYLVKNFSADDIFVSFAESGQTQNNSIRIVTGYGQKCYANMRGGLDGQNKTNTVYISGSGEVEVQQVYF